MIWNSSPRIRPRTGSGALRVGPFLVLFRNSRIPTAAGRAPELNQSELRGTTARHHIHNTLQERLDICSLLSWTRGGAFSSRLVQVCRDFPRNRVTHPETTWLDLWLKDGHRLFWLKLGSSHTSSGAGASFIRSISTWHPVCLLLQLTVAFTLAIGHIDQQLKRDFITAHLTQCSATQNSHTAAPLCFLPMELSWPWKKAGGVTGKIWS